MSAAGRAARALPDPSPRSRWVVRARRHPEGGDAALTMQLRPDGLLALLVAGEGRGGCLLDADTTGRLLKALAGAREEQGAEATNLVMPARQAPRPRGEARGVPLPVHDEGRGSVPLPSVVPLDPDGAGRDAAGRARRWGGPSSGRGPARVGGRIVVGDGVHELLCGFAPTRDRLEDHPGLQPCAGCGMAVWRLPRAVERGPGGAA